NNFEDDGYVEIEELRSNILKNDCFGIPFKYQQIIMNNVSTFFGRVNFETFYDRLKDDPVTIKSAFNSYCKWLLPPQKPKLRQQHRRVRRSLNERILSSSYPGEDMTDGPYEEEVVKRICPPPVFIFLFTVVELAVFLSDVWYHYD
uniref:Uncharacterized protein n=1 Tax=Megaselia scalaris TaxID=36166 RepID=T1GY87_MEGSC